MHRKNITDSGIEPDCCLHKASVSSPFQVVHETITVTTWDFRKSMDLVGNLESKATNPTHIKKPNQPTKIRLKLNQLLNYRLRGGDKMWFK